MAFASKTSAFLALGWIVLASGCGETTSFNPAAAFASNTATRPAVAAARVRAPEIHPQVFIVPSPQQPTPMQAVSEQANAAPAAPDAEPEPDAQAEVSAAATVSQHPQSSTRPPAAPVPVESSAPADDVDAIPGGFALLGEFVPPGQMQQLTWAASETFAGTAIPTAVLVVNGTEPGPTLCLTAAVHGDELNGIEIVRRLVHDVNPEKLTGTLIAVPIVNLEAFQRHSRYLPDRRDLNRFFPGNPTGSSASRIAHSFFNDVIRHCEALVDLHTGSFYRANLPQLRADLNVPSVVELTQSFGGTVTLHSAGTAGTLRRAAVDAGIPAVTLEAGAPLQVQDAEVKHAVKSIHTLLDKMGMYDKRGIWGNPEPVYYASRWVRADSGGILFGQVKLGKRVKVGDVLGTVTDPISNQHLDIVSPFTGRVLGMAMDQFVMPGFATFHIGIETEVDEATQDGGEPILDHALADYEPERNQYE